MVIGIDAAVDGQPCTIVDISRSGVRLLRHAPAPPAADTVQIDFTMPPDRRFSQRSFSVIGRLVRTSEMELVYAYIPPCPDWTELLRLCDTFAQTELVQL